MVSGGGEQSYSSRRAQAGPMVLPSASRASRGGAYDEDAVPRHPPYVAYISNLPYEVDEESIAELFTGLKVGFLYFQLPKSMHRTPKDLNMHFPVYCLSDVNNMKLFYKGEGVTFDLPSRLEISDIVKD